MLILTTSENGLPAPSPTMSTKRQNPVLVALIKRHASTTVKMRDRRTPRGGCRNRQRDYREERY